jgi:DNA replication protein DnaC
MSDAKPLSGELTQFFGERAATRLPTLAGSGSWTDEQWAEHDARVTAQRDAEEKQGRPKRMLEENWPSRAIEAAQVADVNKLAIARIKLWNPKQESILILSGPPGCGKTTAAAWWGLQRTNAPSFMRATSFAASSRYDREARAEWRNAGCLVLDDLGSEYADTKGNFLVDLDELVDTFYGDRKPLLITTNCTADEFKKRYGQRITDRLRECGSWASVSEASLRKKP